MNMSKAIDLTNTKIGELTIINLVPEELRRNKYRRREWLCKCSCGNEIIVEQRNFINRKGDLL